MNRLRFVMIALAMAFTIGWGVSFAFDLLFGDDRPWWTFTVSTPLAMIGGLAVGQQMARDGRQRGTYGMGEGPRR